MIGLGNLLMYSPIALWLIIAALSVWFSFEKLLRPLAISAHLFAMVLLIRMLSTIGPEEAGHSFFLLIFALLGLAFVIATPKRQSLRDAVFTVSLAEAATFGYFSSSSLVERFFFWNLILVPVFFSVGLEGLQKRSPHLRAYGLYQVIGSLAYLLATVILSENQKFLSTSSPILLVAGLLFVLAGMLRQGIFPFHSPFLTLFDKAPLSLVLPLVGSCMGFLPIHSLGIPLLSGPYAAVLSAPSGAFLMAGLVYFSLLALVQKTLRGLLCMEFLFLSTLLASCLSSGQLNAAAAWAEISLGLLTLGGLSLVMGSLEQRLGVVNLTREEGLFAVMPKLGGVFVLFGLALTGAPLSFGMVGEDLLLHGLFDRETAAGLLLILATSIVAIAHMKAFKALFVGNVCDKKWIRDINTREKLGIGLVLAPILILGLCPSLMLSHLPSPKKAVDMVALKSLNSKLSLLTHSNEIRQTH